jgi:hypothetical protein
METNIFKYITQWLVYQDHNVGNLDQITHLVNAIWFKSPFSLKNALGIYKKKKGKDLISPEECSEENFTDEKNFPFIRESNLYLFHGESLSCDLRTDFIQFCLTDKKAKQYIVSKEDLCPSNSK